MARGDPEEQRRSDEVARPHLPAGPPPPPARRPTDEEALHPARHLQARQLGRGRIGPAATLGGWAPPGEEAGLGTPIDRTGGETAPVASGAPPPRAPAGGARGWRRPPARWSRRTALVAVLGLALAAAAASTAVALLAQTHPATPPTPAAIPPVPSADAIGNLRMFSQSTGWAQRLDDGAIVHTTGGMGHWAVASPPPGGQLLAVAYVGPEAARAVIAPSGTMGAATLDTWITQDGGAAWSQGGTLSVRGFNASVGGTLDFVDAERGWFSQIEAAGGVAGTALFRTVDGGESWSQVAATGEGSLGSEGVIPRGCDDLTAAFVSASTGFMTGTCLATPPPLYVTHDGGVTWAAAPLAGLPAGVQGGTSFSPTFTSGRSGTLLTEDQTEDGVSTSVFATGDGGLSWQPRYTATGSPVAADFLDADHGWLVTDNFGIEGEAELFATTDGGSAWTHLNAFPFEGIGLDFLTREVGWAAPVSSAPQSGPTYVIQTADGGRTWTAVLPRILGPSSSP